MNLSFFTPYKLLLEIAVVGALLVGAASWWHHYLAGIDQGGYDRRVAEDTKKDLANEREHAADTARLQKEKDDAEIKAAQREKILVAALAAASGSSARVQSALATIDGKIGVASVDAARQYATTLGSVFGDCQRKYLEMGKDAAGHASDSLKYQQSWPQQVAPQP